jgi:6-phosphogluconolactonase
LPDGRFVFATDLGIDRVLAYTLDATGQLIPAPNAGASAEPGSGPRHFAFAPDGETMYVINELTSTLTAFAYDAESGSLNRRQTLSTVPDGFHGVNWCAHVVVSPDGRFVYGSNRGHDSIAIWAVDREDGALNSLGHVSSGGETPRNFTLDPSGAWLLVANQDSDNVVVMGRDPQTGLLADPTSIVDVPTACCLVFA